MVGDAAGQEEGRYGHNQAYDLRRDQIGRLGEPGPPEGRPIKRIEYPGGVVRYEWVEPQASEEGNRFTHLLDELNLRDEDHEHKEENL
jgi:hypothetical protein